MEWFPFWDEAHERASLLRSFSPASKVSVLSALHHTLTSRPPSRPHNRDLTDLTVVLFVAENHNKNVERRSGNENGRR